MKKLLVTILALFTMATITVTPANAAVTATLSKSVDLVASGDSIKVNLSGIPTGQGVYVRLCKQPLVGARPSSSDCYGGSMGGVWASLDSSQQALGAANAANQLTLPVIGEFTNSGNIVNCITSQCVVFIRRDHNGGGGDFSLDSTIPVSFAGTSEKNLAAVPSPITDQTISPFWNPGKYNKKVNRNSTKQIARKAMLTAQGNSLTWTSNTPKTCAVTLTKKYVTVKYIGKGVCEFNATATSTDIYKPTVFSWKYSVK